jgi:hypothetical protein
MDELREYIKQCWLNADDALAEAELLESHGDLSKGELAKIRTVTRKAYKLFKSFSV